MTALRALTSREESIVSKYSAQHGTVRAANQAVVDSSGGIGAPLVRLPLLARLQARGTITPAEEAAGERFAELFRLAQIDPLRSADMSRSPAVAGFREASLSSCGERARKQISAALVALGGGGTPVAGAAWNILGMEMTVAAWAQATQRRRELASGILIASLGLLASHFAGAHRRA